MRLIFSNPELISTADQPEKLVISPKILETPNNRRLLKETYLEFEPVQLDIPPQMDPALKETLE